jgi:hypothetical protein
LEIECTNGDFASVECSYDPNHGDALENATGDLVLLFSSSQRIVHPLLGNCPTSRFKIAPQMPGYKLCKICSYYIDARQFGTHHQQCEAQAQMSGAPTVPTTLIETDEGCASVSSLDAGMPAATAFVEEQERVDPVCEQGRDEEAEVERRVKPARKKLNWSDEELLSEEVIVVNSVKAQTRSILDGGAAEKEAKRLALEMVHGLSRVLRNRLLQRFERTKWSQFARNVPPK